MYMNNATLIITLMFTMIGIFLISLITYFIIDKRNFERKHGRKLQIFE